MARKSIEKIETEIKETKTKYLKARKRCEDLENRLIALQKEKEKREGEMILKALKKSGKSYRQLMAFLGA